MAGNKHNQQKSKHSNTTRKVQAPLMVKKTPLTNGNKKSKPLDLMMALIISICGVFLYSNTVGHSFVLDDFSVIVENKITNEGSKAIPKIFKSGYRDGNYIAQDKLYRPLTKAMFAVEYEMSQGKPGLSHWINVILYGLLCGFIFLGLRRFFSGQYYLALIATLLFTFHPIHTEVVANIKSRDEILSLFFILGSLWFAKSYADSGKLSFILPAGICYLLALFTKESAITYVALLPISLYFVSKISIKQNAMITAVMAVITGVYLYIHLSVIGSIGLTNIPIPDNSLLESKDFAVQRMTAIEILGRYLKLLVFPHPLSSDYSFNTIPLVKSAANIGFILALLIHIGALVMAIKEFKKKSPLSYGIWFYFITISVVSNVFMLIGTNMAERLLFMPSLGFAILLSFLLVKVLKADKLHPENIAQVFTKKAVLWLILVPVLMVFSVKTYSRNKDWKNVSTLFNKDLETVPNSVHMLYYHAGMITNGDSLSLKTDEQRLKTLQLAEKELNKAIDIYEPFLDAHAQLGKVYLKLTNYDKAIVHFKRFLEMNNVNPVVFNNYGTCLGFKGDLKGAEANFKKAIEISPVCYGDALCNLGSTYIFYASDAQRANNLSEATKYYNMSIEVFKKTIDCDANNINAYLYMGMSYQALGDTTQARTYKTKGEELQVQKNNTLKGKK
jgi:tetratricopeptide (TPR) repeat protein